MSFYTKGIDLRNEFKKLVSEFMQSQYNCRAAGSGMTQADIFRECGMDWGKVDNCTSSQQQFYIVAILKTLELEGKVERDAITKKWKLK